MSFNIVKVVEDDFICRRSDSVLNEILENVEVGSLMIATNRNILNSDNEGRWKCAYDFARTAHVVLREFLSYLLLGAQCRKGFKASKAVKANFLNEFRAEGSMSIHEDVKSQIADLVVQFDEFVGVSRIKDAVQDNGIYRKNVFHRSAYFAVLSNNKLDEMMTKLPIVIYHIRADMKWNAGPTVDIKGHKLLGISLPTAEVGIEERTLSEECSFYNQAFYELFSRVENCDAEGLRQQFEGLKVEVTIQDDHHDDDEDQIVEETVEDQIVEETVNNVILSTRDWNYEFIEHNLE